MKDTFIHWYLRQAGVKKRHSLCITCGEQIISLVKTKL